MSSCHLTELPGGSAGRWARPAHRVCWLRSRHSRVPVHAPGDRQHILGILLVKELVLLDPAEKVRVDTLHIRPAPFLSADTPMWTLLKLFKCASAVTFDCRCKLAALQTKILIDLESELASGTCAQIATTHHVPIYCRSGRSHMVMLTKPAPQRTSGIPPGEPELQVCSLAVFTWHWRTWCWRLCRGAQKRVTLQGVPPAGHRAGFPASLWWAGPLAWVL